MVEDPIRSSSRSPHSSSTPKSGPSSSSKESLNSVQASLTISPCTLNLFTAASPSLADSSASLSMASHTNPVYRRYGLSSLVVAEVSVALAKTSRRLSAAEPIASVPSCHSRATRPDAARTQEMMRPSWSTSLSSCASAALIVIGGLKESAKLVVVCRKATRRLFRTSGSPGTVGAVTVDTLSMARSDLRMLCCAPYIRFARSIPSISICRWLLMKRGRTENQDIKLVKDYVSNTSNPALGFKILSLLCCILLYSCSHFLFRMEDGALSSRGFTLSHQRVILEIDFRGCLLGTAHLTVQPTSPALRQLYLHASSRFDIMSVTLSSPTSTDPLLSTPASYSLYDPFERLPVREPPLDIKSHPEIKRKTWAAMGERDEGELAISVSGGWVRVLQEGESVSLAPIEVRIEYRLNVTEPLEGIVFNRDIPHVYLSPTTHAGARIWTPCVDSLWERCTWELEFIVPRYLEGGEDVPVVVVSSGELVEQTSHPHSQAKSVFYYLQTNPTSVQHIGFAAGPFSMHVLAETPKPMLAFCLPGDEEMMLNSTSFLPRAMLFYSTEYGSYPFTDYKVVFVANPRTTCVTSATLSILSSDLLYPPDIIDQAIITRQTLSLTLIQQWIGVNIIQRALCDTWLVNGLALYLHSLFLRHLLGNNEYRFRLKKDMDRCAQLDQGQQWPLCVPGALDVPDIDFVNLKAPLVLHILDRHIVKAGTSLGLARVIPRIFLSALSDELSGNTLSTTSFFRTCRKVSGIDLATFQDQWVFGSGCPRLRVQANFIRKKFVVELTVQQEIGEGPTYKRQTPLFEGSLTVRIHEADGAPFEHLLDIKSKQKAFSLPFNTKYKRTRRSGHVAARYNKMQDDLAAADDAEEAKLREVDRAEVFAYPPWDDESERTEWKVAEWSAEDATAIASEGGGYEWIKLDPECEWLAVFEFVEKPWFWVSQLQGDRDVVAQLEAVQNMALYQSPVVASELARTVLVKNYFYRVRMEAARALVNFCSATSDYGLFYLLKLQRSLFMGPNSFEDISDYFLKKSIIAALADLRNPTTGMSWPEVRGLLLDALRNNDNTHNMYSDSFWLATLVTAIGNAFSASDDHASAAEVIDRVLTMDRLVPSFRNVVTEAALQSQLKAILAGQRMNNPRTFLPYTREGNYEAIRLIAFDCLLICRPPGRSMALTTHLVEVIRDDESLVVRRHVARAMAEAILWSLAVGEVMVPPPGVEEQEAAGAHQTALVKALRKDYSKKGELRQLLQDLLLGSFAWADDELRLTLIKIAEMTTSSQAEPNPDKLIRLPTVETPVAMTPKIRLSLGEPKEESSSYFPVMPKIVVNAKKKKPAQSTGLSDTDLVAIQTVLRKLIAHNSSEYFRRPVDPVRDGAPDYPQVIRTPMDLGTISSKLEAGSYSNRQGFVKDIRLIISNCYTYNPVGSPVRLRGGKFEAYFNDLWTKTEATLSLKPGPPAGAQLAPQIMPIIPVPVAAPGAQPKPSTKLKVKTDTPMPPPPIPPNRKNSVSIVPPDKKRKIVRASAVDDLLGAEVDAMEREQQPDALEALLEPTPKKIAVPREVKINVQPSPLKVNLQPSPLKINVQPSPPPGTPPTITNTMPLKQKRAKALIAALQKDPSATIFLRPVDPIALGIPTYLDEIKEPMDFSTIAKAIDARKYTTMGQVARDIELVFKNCRQFNTPGDFAYQAAEATEKSYWREWTKAVSPRMTADERKAMSGLLSKALKDIDAQIFWTAVDPVAMNLPNYFDIIPPDEARDLTLIKNNLDKGKYTTTTKVDEEIETMLDNCRIFNGEGPISDTADRFGRWWKKNRSKME
ncbi:hypothetical protein BCR39DRAFT_514465 [Naematelia encephala]|uniref:Transcription initiation factor TFIID subunit 2 n=1 Tax=Naematelia encephala TaxID=71784 RepID=A0A1Y2BJH6_9TREE|nr:hypothetical protein BCR39DRAFT_514465 [Naematelia encephala]